MSCNECTKKREVTETNCAKKGSNYNGGVSSFVLVIVLYILLAIIVGSYII